MQTIAPKAITDGLDYNFTASPFYQDGLFLGKEVQRAVKSFDSVHRWADTGGSPWSPFPLSKP